MTTEKVLNAHYILSAPLIFLQVTDINMNKVGPNTTSLIDTAFILCLDRCVL